MTYKTIAVKGKGTRGKVRKKPGASQESLPLESNSTHLILLILNCDNLCEVFSKQLGNCGDTAKIQQPRWQSRANHAHRPLSGLLC